MSTVLGRRKCCSLTSEVFRNIEVGIIWLTINEDLTRKVIALCNKTTR